jgi:hypothetical protein
MVVRFWWFGVVAVVVVVVVVVLGILPFDLTTDDIDSYLS